ncbi:MAG: class I SAM-dependent methyltransferase [Ginsengibacter sp.]
MIRNRDDMYTGGQYLENTGNWNVEDSWWKADLVFDIYKKNGLQPKSIVEVGCGAGAILETLQKKDAGIKKLTGFDISPQAISLAKTRSNSTLEFFQDDFLKVDFPVPDLVLMMDVMEHVEDFYSFMRTLSAKGQRFVFHIPMDLSCRTLLKPHVLLQQRESVGHIHYFSEEMIFWILKDTGYKIIDLHYTKPVIDFQPVKGAKARVKKILRNLSFRINPGISAKLWGGYSLLILAEPVKNPSEI